MATVHLTDLWVHLHANPAQHIRIDHFISFTASHTADGEVRTYAGGRQRIVRRASRRRSLQAQFDATREQVRQLEEWAGEELMFRDPAGRKVYGTYFEVPVTEHDGGEWVGVSLAVHEVTISEAV